MSVITNRSFLPLWVSHFFSAINNNFIRTVFLFFITYKMVEPGLGLIAFAVLLYAVCFGGSSLWLGQVADKFSLKKFLFFTRLGELALVPLAWGCVALDSKWLAICLIPTLGGIGAAARIADYALIPHLVEKEKLNEANAWLKMMTMLGLGIATLFMVAILKVSTPFPVIFSVGIVLSLVAFGVIRFLPDVSADDPDLTLEKNPKKIWSDMAELLKHQFDLVRYLLGIAWFWLIMTTMSLFAPEYGDSFLHVRWSVIMFLTVIFAFGYTVGALLYSRFFKQEKAGAYSCLTCLTVGGLLFILAVASTALSGLTVPKAMTIYQFMFGTTSFVYWCILVDIFVLGAVCACYIIPFYTLLQLKSPTGKLGRVLGVGNTLNASLTILAFIGILGLKVLFFNLITLFVILSFCTVGMAVYMLHLLPTELQKKTWRWVLTKLFKVEISGLENLPAAGQRALIIPNHTSYLDMLLISTFVDQKILFAMNEQWLESRAIRILASLMDVRPLVSSNPLTIKDMVEELKADKLCMVFTHGLVQDGNTRLKIYEGAAMMAYKADAPIVPIQISGARHTFFSRVLKKNANFRLFPKITLKILPPVKLTVDETLPVRQKREKISSQVYDIVTNMSFDAYDKDTTILEATIQCMEVTGRFKPVLEDTSRKVVNFSAFFLKTFALGQILKSHVGTDARIGILLPTSNACALTVLALHTLGKTPAMINFSSGPTQVVSTCKTVELKKIITAHKVISLAKLEPLIAVLEENGFQVLYLEDMAKTAHWTHKAFGVLGALFPRYAYKKACGGKASPNDTAAILFTSGSEGMPKAVFLSHKNIMSNCVQLIHRVDLTKEDTILCCLPMFHSFGILAGCFAPLILGIKSVLYPTPLHYRIIPEMCAAVRATIFFATDTFLMGYAKCANPYDFNSLRLVVCGAERLKDETRKIWLDKFGIRLLEGYGATECAPVLGLSSLLHHKVGSVGRGVPGMTYELKPVPGITEGQELWVKGPNVMQGYMRHTAPGVLEPPEDGWYDTGDIVSMDEEGFIFIKGRSKRFAKIGGEMVSLTQVEDVIHKRWAEASIGAVNIPDDKKGEKIVLITTEKSIDKDGLLAAFKAAGAPEIGIPSKIIYTDNPPLLGTGKFDYVKAKEMALADE